MQGPEGKTYVAVLIGCGLFVTVEVPDGMTEADVVAQFREGQRCVLLVAVLLGISGVLALVFWG